MTCVIRGPIATARAELEKSICPTFTVPQNRFHPTENTHNQTLYPHMQNFMVIPMVALPKSGKVRKLRYARVEHVPRATHKSYHVLKNTACKKVIVDGASRDGHDSSHNKHLWCGTSTWDARAARDTRICPCHVMLSKQSG